ncbi:hypothetical protein AJ88_34785 [Mesorhizobium amorphae CCBAU 01583]|nr:hypothetical protein AJ88_34785 [Mesorhizobium amorphae CCBAU 01583]
MPLRKRRTTMNALCWRGKGDIRCDTVDDPTIEDDQDIKETACHLRVRPASHEWLHADDGIRR